jgi:DNA-binding NtrC family response regulator
VSEIKTQLQQRTGVVVTTMRVEVVDGPDRGANATAVDTLAVGTAKDNGLPIGDFTVSRYHLEASAHAGGILVTDLGSTNGTYVGGVRIERAIVPPGTLVSLGGTTIRFEDAVRRTVPAADQTTEYAGMIAKSPQMLRLFSDIARIATTPTSVLIVGESGTGKERVAEALHTASGRAGEPLVTIDCGALTLTSALLASELFGHERGAFTGADRTHVGAFERAGAGTVFLDEIGELPAPDQASLLGVLERRRIRRVGGTAEVDVNARVIAATNRDLRAEVNNGRFRHDLYHRLAVVVLRLPPLRERREDILPLVAHFARDMGATDPLETVFGQEALARWQRHPWPGNVRELRNAVEAALVVGPGMHLDAPVSGGPDARQAMLPYKDARAAVVGQFEREYLTRLLEETKGNVSAAARTAKMDRSHLIDLLHRHGLKE